VYVGIIEGNFVKEEILPHWIMAGVLLCISLYIVVFNVSRQFLNQRNKNHSINHEISGVAFLGTFFALAGLGVAPIDFKWWFFLLVVVEIPAIISFSAPTNSISDSEEIVKR